MHLIRTMVLSPGGVRLDDVLRVCQMSDGVNTGLLKELLSLFIDENATRIGRALHAAEQGDVADFSAAVHAIRGSASLLGADRLEAIARDCEHRAQDGAINGVVAAAARELRDEFNAVAATLRARYPDLLDR